LSRYTQLSLEERCSIARRHEAGQSIRQIATALDRQPSTVARELKRNTGRKIGYQPAYAQAQASPAKKDTRSSVTKPITASSMLN
jgi:transposase, IS30 family